MHREDNGRFGSQICSSTIRTGFLSLPRGSDAEVILATETETICLLVSSLKKARYSTSPLGDADSVSHTNEDNALAWLGLGSDLVLNPIHSRANSSLD